MCSPSKVPWVSFPITTEAPAVLPAGVGGSCQAAWAESQDAQFSDPAPHQPSIEDTGQISELTYPDFWGFFNKKIEDLTRIAFPNPFHIVNKVC